MTADPLGEALHLLRMSGSFYGRSELTAPWGVTVPPMPGCLWFHVVLAGAVRLESGPSGEAIWLRPGDLALVPRGDGHVLRSEEGVDAPGILQLEREAFGERYELLRHGGGGAATTVICAAVRFDHPVARNLVDSLPHTILMAADAAPDLGWMQSTIRLMDAESRGPRPGGEAVVTRLADVLAIHAIRFWIETDPAARTGWLAALRDPRIGRAIVLIHREPQRPWTVASLASEVAMSRSAFAARFTELTGEPVMQYLTRWRMHVTEGALRDEGVTVGEVAARFGYRSEAAFARAFKRVTGRPPGAVRRTPRPLAGAAALGGGPPPGENRSTAPDPPARAGGSARATAAAASIAALPPGR